MPNRIVQFSSPRDRKVRGTDVKIGDQLYAIQDLKTKLYFVWCYTDRGFAEQIAAKAKPDSAIDIACNWRRDKAQLVASNRTQK